MRASVIELFAFEVDLRTAIQLGQALGEIQRAGPADELGLEAVELGEKVRLGQRGIERLLKIKNQRHQGFGDKAPAERTELALGVCAAAEIGVGLHNQYLF